MRPAWEVHVNVLALRPESTPNAPARVSLFAVGDVPAFLADLDPPAQSVSRPELLPLGGVDMVVVTGTAEAPADQLLRRVRERLPHVDTICLVPDLNDVREVALLQSGACLALDVNASEVLHRARFNRHYQATSLRVRLRNADPAGDGDGEAHARHLAALSFASRLLTTITDETEVFQRLVEIVARELSSRRVSLMQVNREAGLLEMRVAVGIPKEVVRAARPRLGQGLTPLHPLQQRQDESQDSTRSGGIRRSRPEGAGYF